MRDLLYNAAKHYRQGKMLEENDVKAAMNAYGDALRDLHAVQPQRMRDVLLAQVHLSRYQLAVAAALPNALEDLRFGYSYARTTREPAVQELAERLWQEHLNKRTTAIRTLR